MDEVSIDIQGPPERVYDLISDVTQMGRWSPECHRCEWLDEKRFKGWNKRGLMRWSTVSTVQTAERPSHFAFEVDNSGMRWGYRMEPTATGTRVTEYRQEMRGKPWFVRLAYAARLLGKDPDAIVVRGMHETLDRLKAAAELPDT